MPDETFSLFTKLNEIQRINSISIILFRFLFTLVPFSPLQICIHFLHGMPINWARWKCVYKKLYPVFCWIGMHFVLVLVNLPSPADRVFHLIRPPSWNKKEATYCVLFLTRIAFYNHLFDFGVIVKKVMGSKVYVKKISDLFLKSRTMTFVLICWNCNFIPGVNKIHTPIMISLGCCTSTQTCS